MAMNRPINGYYPVGYQPYNFPYAAQNSRNRYSNPR